MNSPHEILGISSNSTLDQIEAAFQEKSEYWRRLQSNSQRSAEAKAMLDQVIAAYDFLRTQAQSAASGLEYREPRSFSGQTGVAPVDKDRCPHCGHKDNPPDARFCLNVNCRGQLFQLCPSCHKELPWHYQSCPQCGVDIEAEFDKLRRIESEQQRHLEVQKLQAQDEARLQAHQEIAAVRRRIAALEQDLSMANTIGGGDFIPLFSRRSITVARYTTPARFAWGFVLISLISLVIAI